MPPRRSKRTVNNIYNDMRVKNANALSAGLCTKYGRELRVKHTTNAGRGLRMCGWQGEDGVPVVASHQELVDLGYVTPGRVKVGPATHAEAGNGLIATQRIRKGTFLASYGGKVTREEDKDARSDYVMNLFEQSTDDGVIKWVIDGNPKKYPQRGHLAMFCNSVGAGPYADAEPNAQLITFVNASTDQPFRREYDGTFIHAAGVQALRNIRPGEEILVDYGDAYWQT